MLNAFPVSFPSSQTHESTAINQAIHFEIQHLWSTTNTTLFIMLSFLRACGPVKRDIAANNPVTFQHDPGSIIFHPTANRYFMTHVIPPKSFLNPPTHIHFWQTEYFNVQEGTGIWYLPTDSDASKRQQVKKAGDEPIHLPAGTYHRFENSSDTEQLVVDIRIDPETVPRGMEEMFFRNFFGYLDDCMASKTAPSLFQLALFLYTVDSALAIPIPGPEWLKLWTSKTMGWVLGIAIGSWLLGYKPTYHEYYREEHASLT
jgi:mannose-6-phosphate isomerase-like protein (cupin superfamily)